MNIYSNGFEEELPNVITKRKGAGNDMMQFSLVGHGQQRRALGTDALVKAHYKALKKVPHQKGQGTKF